MCSPGINGEGELRGQPANPGLPGKIAVKTVCVLLTYLIVCVRVTVRRDVEDTWANFKFVVVKYVKGGVERGYTVGGVEEVVQVLDDNCLQLQGMAGSRFVGPFLNVVQRWEQTLSLISEVRGTPRSLTTMSPSVFH